MENKMVLAAVAYIQAEPGEIRDMAISFETTAAHAPKSLARKLYNGEKLDYGVAVAFLTPESRGLMAEFDQLDMLLRRTEWRGLEVFVDSGLEMPYSEYAEINGIMR